jgi:hypothetical protein
MSITAIASTAPDAPAQLVDEGRTFAVNAPAVASQIIEGEAIIIHFERGHYFSAKGSAAEALALLESGRAPSAVAASFVVRYGLDTERAAASVGRFVAELLAEGLIVASDASPALGGGALAEGVEGAPLSFEEPRLVKFTDLQDVLVLDPLHDVMMPGWPLATP